MRGRGGILAAGAAALLAIAAVAWVLWPQGDQDMAPDELTPAAIAPDLPALALDGTITTPDLFHDSRGDAYRQPSGAVPAGTEVTLRLRAAAGDLSDATIRIWDALAESQVLVPMTVVARDATAGEHGYDWWEATLPTTNLPSVLYYRFIVRDGAASAYLEDDALLDGGDGEALDASQDRSWQLVTHDPEFATPEWARGAVVYQVFPDRFANGDPSNDPSPDVEPGAEGAARYRSGEVYGNDVLVRDWDTDLPEGYCRAYVAAAEPCDEEPLGRDFYGGDLAGIREHLPELAELGVTVLYLNPIFAAPSNHRYDTSDYTVIDPDLGTEADLEALTADAEALGIRVLLDGVFNHTSSDSPFFDRSGRYPEVGACEAADSEWASWYTLAPGPPEKCFDGQTYEDWFGFDTLAVLAENPDTFGYFLGEDGIATRWLDANIAGWRLDVMNEISHDFLRGLRRSIKAANPEALVLGEEWGDASAWLLGTEADSVMNYRFRRAVIGLVNGQTADADGEIPPLTPQEFARTMEGVREDYPAPAWDVLHNLVDSHDTTRILWTLTPGADNREEKESEAALAVGEAKLRVVAALQLTWPGMSGIYYGTEAGLTGHDDPDDRRPYPRGREDAALRDWYARLGTLRGTHESLRSGDLQFLPTSAAQTTLAYGRRTEDEAAITVLNLADVTVSLEVDVDGWLPSGTLLTDQLGGDSLQVTDGHLAVDLEPHGAAVFITEPGQDLRPPEAPGSSRAEARSGAVTVSWDAVPDAAGYRVWRSVLSGGGYEPVGSTAAAATSFVDGGARNGVLAHYVVTALDAAGNEGPRSPETSARPQVTVADARLVDDEPIRQPLSAVDAGAPIEVSVEVAGFSGVAGPTVGTRLEVGHGPAGGEAHANDEAWTWTPMTFGSDAGGNDRWTGAARPEEAGTYAVAARISTDGGTTWLAIGTDGMGDRVAARELTATAPADADPPEAPGGLVATSVAETAVTIAWDAVADEDVHRYEVLRAEGDADLERVGIASQPAFTDESVASGRTYRYAVRAQDESYNRSEASAEIEVGAEARDVTVTFTLTVPERTPAGETVYIAGDFQGWDPGATPMTQVDATTWRIELTFPEATPLQYKYARGTWLAVEKDADCAELPNRELTVEHGTDGTLAQADTVATWRDVDGCP